MRFVRFFRKASPAVLATAALILITGVAGAFFNSSNSIDPDSPNYDGSAGYVDASGPFYETGVYLMCSNSENDFEIGCDSWHPDSVNMTSKQGKVDQKKKDNNADAWIAGSELGGAVGDFDVFLDCQKVQIKGKSNDDKQTIESKCTLTKCELPQGITLGQIESAADCIEESEDSGAIGKKVSTLKLDGNNLLKGNIWSKGIWEAF